MVTYNRLLVQLALTTNSFAGVTTPATLNTVYDINPLTVANFNTATGSSIFSFHFLLDKLLNAQEGLFLALASTATNPLRGAIESQTDVLAYGDPALTNAAGLPIVGAYGAVRDAEDGEPCTLNELEIIRMKHLAAWMTLPVYEYAWLDTRIFHTRTEVVVDVCGYERPDTDTLDLTSEILLPDVLGPAVVQGAVGECYRDDEYLAQAARGNDLHGRWVEALQAGMAQVEQQTNPTPDAQKAYSR
jgi:hypothetical protein